MFKIKRRSNCHHPNEIVKECESYQEAIEYLRTNKGSDDLYIGFEDRPNVQSYTDPTSEAHYKPER